MEMEDSVLRHIMNTQTQMLQQMQQMQTQQTIDTTKATPVASQAAPISGAAVPITGVQSSGMSSSEGFVGGTISGVGVQTAAAGSAFAFSPTPLAYTPPTDAGISGTLQRQDPAAYSGLTGQLWNNYVNYNPMQQSKEGRSEYFSAQTRAIQEGALNAGSVLANGAATLGSFMIPGGFLASMAIGTGLGAVVAGGTKMMVDQGRLAMDYEDTLRTKSYKFLNPYESTSETGGIGFSRQENQDLSQFLRHIGPEKFLGDQDIQKVLNGALDHKMMKSATDVESFKKKFSEIVDTVKQITVTMDQSIEEATKFMGEMERRGIKTSDMTLVAARSRVAGSMLGVSASQASDLILQGTDQVVQGTAIDATTVSGTTTQNVIRSAMIYDSLSTRDPILSSYIKNNGGAGQVGIQTEQSVRQYIDQNSQSVLLGLLGSAFKGSDKGDGRFVIDEREMRSLLDGDLSSQELTQRSRSALNGMSQAQQFSLQQQAPLLFQNFADSQDQFRLMQLDVESLRKQNPQYSVADALQIRGVSRNRQEAELMAKQMEYGVDKDVQWNIGSKILMEEMDSKAIAESPSIPQRARFGLSKIKADLGDAAQGFADGIGDASFALGQWSAGFEDRSRTGRVGDRQFDFSQTGFQREFSVESFQKMNENFVNMERLTTPIATGGGTMVANGVNPYQNAMFDLTQVDSFSKGQVSGTLQPGNGKMSFDKLMQTFGYKSPTKSFSDAEFENAIEALNSGQLSASYIANLKERQRSGGFGDLDSKRIDYLANKAEGKYDGASGQLKQGLDLGNIKVLGGLSEATKSGMNAVFGGMSGGNSMETTKTALDKQQKDLEDMFLGANKELSQILNKGTQGLGLSNASDLDKLEGYITAGDVEGTGKLTNNAQASSLAKRYKELLDADAKGGGAYKQYEDMLKYAEAESRGVKKIKDFATNSGVGGHRFDQLANVADKTLKEIKNNDLSVGEFFESDKTIKSGMLDVVANMTSKEKSSMVRELEKNTPLKATDVFVSKTDNSIDTNKLVDALMKLAASDQSGNPLESKLNQEQTKQSLESSKGMKEALDGHAQTMSEMIATFQKEMAMMRDAINGRQVRSSSSTSVSSKNNGWFNWK